MIGKLIQHLNELESELTYVRGDHDSIEVWFTETEKPRMEEVLGMTGAVMRLQELLVKWARDNAPNVKDAMSYVANHQRKQLMSGSRQMEDSYAK